MEITQTANWHYVDTNTKHRAGYKGHRIEIAGYTAVVEEQKPAHWSDETSIFEFSVLKDHFAIIEVGQRLSLETAKAAAEQIIRNDLDAR